MASSADDITRITEILDEKTLAVAIAAACGSPSKTFRMCQTLGVTTAVEKIAKSVSKLKRDSEEQFGMNWLSKILELLNQKIEFEELSEMRVAEINWGIHDQELQNLWADHFVKSWREKLLSRTKRFRHDGAPLIVNHVHTVKFTKRLADNYRIKKIKADGGKNLIDGNWLHDKNDHITDLSFTIEIFGSKIKDGGSIEYGGWLFRFTGHIDPSVSQIDVKNYRSTRQLSRVEFMVHEKSTMRKVHAIIDWLQENNLVQDNVVIKKNFV